jgi:hypothetical protein
MVQDRSDLQGQFPKLSLQPIQSFQDPEAINTTIKSPLHYRSSPTPHKTKPGQHHARQEYSSNRASLLQSGKLKGLKFHILLTCRARQNSQLALSKNLQLQ